MRQYNPTRAVDAAAADATQAVVHADNVDHAVDVQEGSMDANVPNATSNNITSQNVITPEEAMKEAERSVVDSVVATAGQATDFATASPEAAEQYSTRTQEEVDQSVARQSGSAVSLSEVDYNVAVTDRA